MNDALASPRRYARRVLVVLVLLGFASCGTTRVVIADPDRGAERVAPFRGGDGYRSVRLQYDRAQINDRDIAAPPVCYACLGAEDESGAATFNLQFYVVNETPAQWELGAKMFHLRSVPGTGEGARRSRVERVFPSDDTVLASVAPYATARVPVVFSVRGVDIDREDSALWGQYDLLVFDAPVDRSFVSLEGGPGAALILERRLSVGKFRHDYQILRFTLFFAAGLLAVGAL